MKKTPFKVNPQAESIAETVAVIFLAVSILAGLVYVVFGISQAEYDSSFAYLGIGLGLIFAVFGAVGWASIMLLVNMSRSLYNINDALRNPVPPIKIDKHDADHQSGTPTNTNTGAIYQVGQLVIIKEDESQFRIDEVRFVDDEPVFYSKKYDCEYSADEIEDFDAYWKQKKM